MARWSRLLAFVLFSQAGHHVLGEIVEAATVTNVVVTATAWDLTSDGGCGVGGCDPRLTRDGKDNTVPDSRWSCTPPTSSHYGVPTTCEITFTMDDYFLVDHIILYLHESNDTSQIAIPFEVTFDYGGAVSELTQSGTALGEGQRVNNEDTTSNGFYTDNEIVISFDLTNGQAINLSEVEIYLDVDNPADVVVVPPAELYIVNAKTVTNVVTSAEYWEMSSNAGCGDAGCVPALTSDGKNNTDVTSRWSCEVESDFDSDVNIDSQRCGLTLTMDDSYIISYIVIYVPDSDDATKEGLSFLASDYSDFDVSIQTTPGTALGTGERFNLGRPLSSVIQIDPNPANVVAGQIIEISEVDIFVEVTDTSVAISAAETWTEVDSDSLTPVTVTASQSLPGFSANETRDGEDNTLGASRWSCNGGTSEYCQIAFEFNDEYTVSYLNIYMHESNDASKEAVSLDICTCGTSFWSDDIVCDCEYYEDDIVGTYVTVPGTPLGEPERVNVLNPLTSSIGIVCRNLTGIGGTLDISEVEIFFQVPDSTPTPAPFFEETPAPTLPLTPSPFSSGEGDDIIDRYFDDDRVGNIGFDDDIIDRYFDDDRITGGDNDSANPRQSFCKGGLFSAAVALAAALAFFG